MLILGVDIAKLNHVASLVDSNSNEIIFSNFKFQNNFNGFSSLKLELEKFNIDAVFILLESTGHYGENFTAFFHNLGFKLGIINPLQTASLRKAKIRDSKNDRLDSITIAQSYLINKPRVISQKDILCNTLKYLNRSRNDRVKERSKYKIKLTGCIDIVFPELQFFFNGIHHKGVYALLKHYNTKEAIAAIRIDKLSNTIYKASHGRFDRDKATALKSLAKTSVGIDSKALSIEITQIIQLIEFLDKQINDLEDEIKTVLKTLNSTIQSIPGISHNASAAIIGEIGIIDKYSHPSKLIALAGIDPKVRQSGNFNASSTRMSKRGSRYLRYALIFTAWNLVRHSPNINAYYQKKRAQGKSHYNALGHVAGKLCRIIFKLLKNDMVYNEDKIKVLLDS